MQFFTITSIAAALVGTANAAVARQTTNPHIADFRLYGDAHCQQPINQGIWTVQSNDFKNGECKALDKEEYPHISILMGDINDGCSMTAYETSDCTEESGKALPLGCTDADAEFVAFSVTCNGHA